MTYKDKTSTAEVRHQTIYFENDEVTPSELASRVANNTSRNAWRDLYIMRPGDTHFELAAVLRRQTKEGEGR